MKKKGEFSSKKKYFKARQILYEQMKSIQDIGDIVEIEGKIYEKVQPERADHVFIWFDRKPMICYYHHEHKSYLVGNELFHISNPKKKTNRVIEFVKIKELQY